MRNAGMRYLYSDKELKNKYSINEDADNYTKMKFGTPDALLYPRILEELKEINLANKPWFANIMTTSTHFPHVVKKEYEGKFGNVNQEAFYTADKALESFIKGLELAGILNDTLLIITGDESAAMIDKSNISSMLNANWGALVIKTPNNDKYATDDFFAQFDLMTSILDYIGHPEKAIRGRSVFRKYEDFRPLMFANIRTDYWFSWYEQNKLIACANYFKICNNYTLNGTLFNGSLKEETKNKDLIDLYISVARKSDYLYTTKNIKKSGASKRKGKKRFRKASPRNTYNFLAPII